MEHILFVFEGEKTEEQIYSAINSKDIFLPKDRSVIISCFGGDIIQLFNILKGDEYLDLFSILKEKDINREKLEFYSVDSFSSIYLFFDYDPQSVINKYGENESKLADFNKKIGEIINFFSNETDKGKIFISYPMIEAIKNAKCCDNLEDFLTFEVTYPECSQFKASMNQNFCGGGARSDIRKYTEQIWKHLFQIHCIKANYIVNSKKDFPLEIIEQKIILDKICTRETIPILSSIPLMVADYYGYSQFIKMLLPQVFVDELKS